MSTARAVTGSLLQGKDVITMLNRIKLKKEKNSKYEHTRLNYAFPVAELS